MPGGQPSPTPLTRREAEVAALIGQGLSNRRIAETLGISQRTAETHVERIFERLGVRSRAQVAAWAARQGLLDDEDFTWCAG